MTASILPTPFAMLAFALAHIPCVLKYDGLANGKGVWVIRSEQDAHDAVHGYFKLVGRHG